MKKKFLPALRGLADAVKDGGIRIQMVLGIVTVCAGIILRFDTAEWLAVIISIALVVSLEMVNTCIERVCDLVSLSRDERIRYIKDLSAGAVLAASLGALAAAAVILYRHFGG